jgi:hypothetical protein
MIFVALTDGINAANQPAQAIEISIRLRKPVQYKNGRLEQENGHLAQQCWFGQNETM